MKEPTMTEFERAAEKYAKRWAKSLGADFLPASLVDEIAEALASHARPAAGFIREATGPDRRVVGPMPITKDGAVVYDRAWWIDPVTGDFEMTGRSRAAPEDAKVMRFDDVGWVASVPRSYPRRIVPLSDCFSTPEDAEAYAKANVAATPAAAQAERGEVDDGR